MSSRLRIDNLYSSIGQNTTAVVCPSESTVTSATALNLATEDRFFMLFDLSIVPLIGAIPLMVIPVFANKGYTEITPANLGRGGIVFDTGIAWAFSSTPLTYTPVPVTDGVVNIRWE